jgi:predicted HTH domain antitoxin
MNAVHLQLEDELLALLRETNMPAELAAREMIVLELYRRGSISSGKAADLLSMPRVAFIAYASHIGIPFLDMTADEWAAERALTEAL